MRKILCFMFLTAGLVSGEAIARDQTGVVDRVITRIDGANYFWLKNVVTNGTAPACATSIYWFIKDENSEAGKKQYAMLMTAKLSGVPLRIYGNGTCTRWATSEDVWAMELAPN